MDAKQVQDVHGHPTYFSLMILYFFFFYGPSQEAIVIKSILNDYEVTSEQSMNLSKLGFPFSPNISEDIKQAIFGHLNIFLPLVVVIIWACLP